MDIRDAATAIIDMNTSNRKPTDGEYIKDGIIYCKACDTPRETVIEHPFTHQMRKVRCICRCQQEEKAMEEAQDKARENRLRIEHNKLQCFGDTGYTQYVFSKDDGKDPENSRRMRNYAANFERFAESGQGLLLLGNPGTGKTFHSACVANDLMDRGYSVIMASVPTLVAKIQRNAFGSADPLADAIRCDLLILDDLGAERSTEYAQEQVYSIVDGRYAQRKPMIVSTNLTPKQLGTSDSITLQRTYGRILERCFPIKYDGQDRRRAIDKAEMRALLDM